MALSRRELLIAGGITAAGTVLTPSIARSQAPKKGGTLNLRLWDPPHFDLHAAGGLSYKLHILMTFTHSRLVRHKTGPSVVPGTFALEPDLAESWTQPNETTYVFKLRRGVRWHNKPPANGRDDACQSGTTLDEQRRRVGVEEQSSHGGIDQRDVGASHEIRRDPP